MNPYDFLILWFVFALVAVPASVLYGVNGFLISVGIVGFALIVERGLSILIHKSEEFDKKFRKERRDE